MNKPVVLIPARGGSKRFPNKNEILWRYTENFIKDSDLFSDVYVSSDSATILELANDAGFNSVKRPAHLSGDEVATRPVIDHLVTSCSLQEEVSCLLYLTSPERESHLFKKAIGQIYDVGFDSVMSFYESEDTPYLSKYLDTLESVIDHDLYRHQDYRSIVQMTHYICLFRNTVLKDLDNQLFSKEITSPFVIPSKPLDIDFQEQYDNWLCANS